jgi:hypothetical protein
LADALGISTETREKSGLDSAAVFGDDLVTYARIPGNGKFVALVEKTFAEWVVISLVVIQLLIGLLFQILCIG